MPPPNPWTGTREPNKAPSDTSFPGLKSDMMVSGQKSMYEEIQEDELVALSSIYGEDFETLDNGGGAWKARLFTSPTA